MTKKIGIIAGSLRKESFSKKIANALVPMAPPGFEFSVVSLEGLEMYNQDYDDHNQVPESYVAFRNTIKGLDGVIFVTPEYNRSLPGVLKNALDIASRPKKNNMWDGKPGAVFSTSPGNLSGFGAHHHLRQVLVALNIPTMAHPEVYLAKVNEYFDDNGAMKEGSAKDFLQKAINSYLTWFTKLTAN